MKTKVSILFYAKRAKASVNGLVPIYTRITINGKRIELSSNRFVEISKWSTEAGKMKGNSEEARSINSHLDMLRIQIIDMQMELVHKKIPVTAETLKSKILGVDERARMLIPIFQDHNNKIKELIGKEYAPGTLEQAYLKHKNKDSIKFVTDGGVENVNNTVQEFLNTTNPDIKHLIAQKDIPFSNSKIEAFNKIIKHQFLLPQNLMNIKQLDVALAIDVLTYNTIRPQLSLQGNTPAETFSGKPVDINHYKTHFDNQKTLRITQNQQNRCKGCK